MILTILYRENEKIIPTVKRLIIFCYVIVLGGAFRGRRATSQDNGKSQKQKRRNKPHFSPPTNFSNK